MVKLGLCIDYIPQNYGFNHLSLPWHQLISGSKRARCHSTIWYYHDVIISAMVSQITGVWSVCSTVCSSADQRKHQSSASLAFVMGIHRIPSQRARNTENVSVWWRLPLNDISWICVLYSTTDTCCWQRCFDIYNTQYIVDIVAPYCAKHLGPHWLN